MTKKAIELLSNAQAELAGVHRAKHYLMWRSETVDDLGHALAKIEPFNAYINAWIFTRNGGYQITPRRFGDWAIDKLVAKATPEDILIGFAAEIQRNASTYIEVSPIFGVHLDLECQLGEGISLVPEKVSPLWWRQKDIPKGTCFLCQSFEVRPAFKVNALDTTSYRDTSIAEPDSNSRDVVRHRVRLACLLASTGPVELPISLFQAIDHSLFSADSGDQVVRPMPAHPRVSYPAERAILKTAFSQLINFQDHESLSRAIDRLGRARITSSTVDKALELGMAAEIALMHGESTSNTEIAHKIGGRAAWLLGYDPAERTNIFNEMKLVYQARSQAVHSGVLSTKSKVNLEAGDKLVARAIAALLARGQFPNWSSLVMGGNG